MNEILEILWKTNDPVVPLSEQEYYELALEDSPKVLGPGYIVRRTRYEWDDTQDQMMAVEHVIDRIRTREVAEARYAQHRRILADLGFVHSDMDLMR